MAEHMTAEQYGPREEISRSCNGCRACVSESYRCQSDSGQDVYCAHPALPERKRIGDTTWSTPDWCPMIAIREKPMTAEQLRAEILHHIEVSRMIAGALELGGHRVAATHARSSVPFLESIAGRLSGMAAVPALMTHRHRKRGTEYREVARGQLQTAEDIGDGSAVVIYAGTDGRHWVRPVAEFDDGRFERVTATPEPPHV